MSLPEKKDCNTSIFIVCEGTKSEPWFLRRFIEQASKRFDTNYYVEIFPTPKSEEDDNLLTSDKVIQKPSGKRKTSGKKLKPATDKVDETPDETPQGGNPLYWVKHGKSKLKSYSEVFVVFDKDGHPKIEDAFNEAAKGDENKKKVTVILNSRSFEYYMLMHYEQLYRSFIKTECGEKRKSKNGRTHTFYYRCCLKDAVLGKACQGNICINGYARSNGYWEESKDDKTFLTANNIWRGMQNSEVVRAKSLRLNPGIYPNVYQLNPYLDFQLLLARLMEMNILHDQDSISKDCGCRQSQTIARQGHDLILTNGTFKLPMKLGNGWIEYYSYPSDYIKFEDFWNQNQFKSMEEAAEQYADLQFERDLIALSVALRVNPQAAITFSLTPLNTPNTFAILNFNDKRYLIL